MALFDFLKRKKEIQKAKEKQPEKEVDKPSIIKKQKETKEIKTEKPARSKKVQEFSYSIVKEPHVSEKSTNLAEGNKYVFKIYRNANKPEIKKSVEGIYGVQVESVNLITIPRKKRRIGRTEGFKKGHRKAVVTIKKGQKIEIF